MTLAIPTIHLNGTSAASLIDAIMTARTALIAAMRAMEDVCPNGRDYYVQGRDATQEALRQHANRMHSLEAVNRELAEIAEAIALQRA
jgi:queuine/archaeosine tRNA-ribosyltransferase